MKSLEKSWYQRRPLWWLLPLTLPLTGLYWALSSLNNRLAQRRQAQAPVTNRAPVVIVGNITVGGTGKTPFTLWLVEALLAEGFRPGIISRGYGGERDEDVMTVLPTSLASAVGDEPLLMAQRDICPVVVGRQRVLAAEHLQASYDVDVIIADDGLQHYALARDFEIVLVDPQRGCGSGLGNGWLLPAGPLRERAKRLQSVQAIVANGGVDERMAAKAITQHDNLVTMQLAADDMVNIVTGERLPLAEFAANKAASEQEIYALAGIGNPERFFNTLIAAGLSLEKQPFPDHHKFTADDVPTDKIVVMTEKDAVKCRAFLQAGLHHDCWMLPVQATLTSADRQRIMQPLINVISH